MKHVDDEFWRRFSPAIQATARAVGKDQFYAFGEVFDQSKCYTSHFTTQDGVQGVLDFPFQLAAQDFAARSQPASDLARVLPRRRLVHRRGLERLPAADVPRKPRHGALRAVRPPGQSRRGRHPRSSPATGWATSSCTSRAATRSSTTATSRASSATAATSSRARTCSPARSRSTTTTTSSAPTRRPRSRTSTAPTASTRRSPDWRTSPGSIARCATAPTSTATPPPVRASTRSRAWRTPSSTSTSSR